ncbi:MAG: PEP-CTERM sorting domain-containing protein [Methyloversatilis discipulorum]|uniref:PEP-CTERM sorting domain-containing protein n=1 Tax=Methyloversatilis discipulorum TaxID=1119528 RepID=UPI0026EAFF24|nr:PEP-CTERM sorting domain-containing protein [Methyloversatilis discipulorum]MBT9517898.1 PEP-CTERM sorting domain-containing protein [Methyloversatilis discipulorum]
MKTHALVRSLMTAGLVLASGAASAAAFADNFESGLNGWSTAGDVSNPGGYIALTTASLTEVDDAPLPAGVFNFSGVTAVEVGVADGLESRIGLTPGALDTADGFAYEGSAMWRELTVSAGDTLRFDWLFATSEPYVDPLPDYAFLLVGDQVIRIADESDAPFPPTTHFRRESNRSTFEYVFTQSGAVRLGFGIVDVGDYTATSALAIDNLSITPVPEPSGWALLLGGLGVIVASARRRI